MLSAIQTLLYSRVYRNVDIVAIVEPRAVDYCHNALKIRDTWPPDDETGPFRLRDACPTLWDIHPLSTYVKVLSNYLKRFYIGIPTSNIPFLVSEPLTLPPSPFSLLIPLLNITSLRDMCAMELQTQGCGRPCMRCPPFLLDSLLVHSPPSDLHLSPQPRRFSAQESTTC